MATESIEEIKLVENEQKENVLDLVKILGELFDAESTINDLKLELKLNDSNIEFIKFILNSFPDCLKEISTGLDDVLEDGKLDISDVPTIVNMVKRIMNNSSKTMKKVKKITVEELINFIKNIIEILIHKDIIKVENKEKVFKLISVSVELLTTSVDVSNSIYDCLKRLFKC